MTFSNRLKSITIKAFMGGEWKVAYRLKTELDGQYNVVEMPEGTCIADPFLYEADGEHYLFVELYDNKKNIAGIGCYQFIDRVPVFKGKIIENSYHMSYPCVFSYKGQHYMIPETSANQTVELYRAEDFPMKWKKVSNLITGERYVDTSVVKQGDSYFAVSYKKNEHGWSLDAFSLDMENNQMTKLGSKTYKTNTGRPGGGFICGENLERPAQNCASKYGENLIIYKIDQLDGIGYEEHEVGKVTVHDIPMKSAPNRVHTYNQDSLYECVDVYFEKIDMLHGLKTLWRAYLRNLLSRK